MYKKYRNEIIELIKLTKQSYHQKFFVDHKKNSWIIWKFIYEIFYFKETKMSNAVSASVEDGKAVTDTSKMTECFKNFLTSKDKIFKKMPPTKKPFRDYLKNPALKKIFCTPAAPGR